MPNDSENISNEKLIIQTDVLIRHLVEKLSNLLIKSPTTENVSSTPVHIAQASTLLSTVTGGDIQQQKELLSNLLYDSFRSKTQAEVATQVTDKNISLTFIFLFFCLDFNAWLKQLICQCFRR